MRIPTSVNLLKTTTEIFNSAIDLMEYKSECYVEQELGSNGFSIDAQNYRYGIALLKRIIIDNKFNDQESFDLVYDSIDRYRQALPSSHKMTSDYLTDYLSYLNTNRRQHIAKA